MTLQAVYRNFTSISDIESSDKPKQNLTNSHKGVHDTLGSFPTPEHSK